MCRNRRLTRVVSLVFLLGLALGQEVYATEPGLVGWWKLDETSGTIAADSSGFGNHGALQGDVRWMPGMIGGAWQGDGNGDYIRVPHSESLDLSERVTVALWVYGGLPPDQILCKGTGGAAWNSSYSFRIDDNAAYLRKINFQYSGSGGGMDAYRHHLRRQHPRK
jgi:hypothetical protein